MFRAMYKRWRTRTPGGDRQEWLAAYERRRGRGDDGLVRDAAAAAPAGQPEAARRRPGPTRHGATAMRHRHDRAARSARSPLSSDLQALVERLAALELDGCANPYREADEDPELDAPGAAAGRRANLAAYLDARAGAPLLLVGEAMGYRGGRFSGIAFTAERTLLEWGAPFRPTSTRTGGWAEPSGTIVHGALAEAGAEHLAVLWNSVPAHPAPAPLRR